MGSSSTNDETLRYTNTRLVIRCEFPLSLTVDKTDIRINNLHFIFVEKMMVEFTGQLKRIKANGKYFGYAIMLSLFGDKIAILARKIRYDCSIN